MGSPLQQLRDEIAVAIGGMSDEQLSRRRDNKWSTAEILEHLYLTYTGSVNGLQKCLDAGRPLAGAPGTKQRIRQFVVIDFGYFPEGRQSPSFAVPSGTDGTKVTSEIFAEIGRMEDAISRCETKFGKSRRLLDHPALGPLSGDQWRKFHLVHGRHHIKQIRRLRKLV
jgi:hypothetical protein